MESASSESKLTDEGEGQEYAQRDTNVSIGYCWCFAGVPPCDSSSIIDSWSKVPSDDDSIAMSKEDNDPGQLGQLEEVIPASEEKAGAELAMPFVKRSDEENLELEPESLEFESDSSTIGEPDMSSKLEDLNGNDNQRSNSLQSKFTNNEFEKWMNYEEHYLEPVGATPSSTVVVKKDATSGDADTEGDDPSSTFQVTLQSMGTTIDLAGGCKTPSSTGTPPPPPESLPESITPKEAISSVSVPAAAIPQEDASSAVTPPTVTAKSSTTSVPAEIAPKEDTSSAVTPPAVTPKSSTTSVPTAKTPKENTSSSNTSAAVTPKSSTVTAPVSKTPTSQPVKQTNGTGGTPKTTSTGGTPSKTASTGAVKKASTPNVTAPAITAASTTPAKVVASGSPARPASRRASAPQTPTTPNEDANKKVPMNKVKVGTAPSPNIKEVKSKVGSLANVSGAAGAPPKKPPASNVKIPEQKLAWKAESKVGSFNTNYVRKGGSVKVKAEPTKKVEVKEVTSKVGSWNVAYKPGGGEKKIFDDKEYLKKTNSTSSSEHGVSGPNTPRPASSAATNGNEATSDPTAAAKTSETSVVAEQKLIDA